MRYILGNTSGKFSEFVYPLKGFKASQFLSSKLKCLLILLITLVQMGNAQTGAAFKMLNPSDRTITAYHSFNSTGTISVFDGIETISGLAVSGVIRLYSDTSLVRIVLIDEQFNEYLVYEAYPMLNDTYEIVFDQVSEETASLDNVKPQSIRVEVSNADCKLFEFGISAEQAFDRTMKRKKLEIQRKSKIERIRENITKNNHHWTAGETSISVLSYAEKKALFGGELPNLNGFEYYTGGIFSTGNFSSGASAGFKSLSASKYVSEFSWRNRHGIDWTTPVKSQGTCGSCWAFSTTGATEMLTNLYFNQKIDPDLSEQNLINSVAGSSCNGGFPGDALKYIRSHGIVSESCLPYTSDNSPDTDACSNPDERINITGIRYFSDKTEETLKNYIINGPLSLGINSWKHTVTLVGYKVLEAGDTIKNEQAGEATEILSPHDPLIGKTAWIIKNSWGTDWGDEGFAYLVIDMNDISSTYQVYGEVKSLNYDESDIACTDADADGYYFWGLGPKPAHCPPCPDEPDSDDSDKCVGPADEYGHAIKIFSEAPLAFGGDQCETQTTAVLSAKGTEIKWYDNTGLVHSGNDYVPGKYSAGIHYFYATQSVDGCESASDTVVLKVSNAPAPPLVSDTAFCEGETIQGLKAVGSNIRWYNTDAYTEQTQKGILPDIKASPGNYIIYATQEQDNCESFPASARITIRPKPIIDLAYEKLTLSPDEGIFLATDPGFENYMWNDGDMSSSKYVSGKDLGMGNHIVSVEVSNEYACSASDSVEIFVAFPNAVSSVDQAAALTIFPNPSDGEITFRAPNIFSDNLVQMYLLDLTGKRVWNQVVPNMQDEIEVSMSFTSLDRGIYILVLTDNSSSFKQRLILK